MTLRGYVLAAATAMLAVGGCATNKSCCPDCRQCVCPTCNAGGGNQLTSAGAPANEAQVFQMPAAELVKHLQGAMEKQGLSITSSQNGVIQTDWKEYEGEVHIARRWQERSRFRASVIPDVNKPTEASRFELTEQSQRRSNDKATWETGNPRPQRAKELAQQIAPSQ